MYDIDNLLDYWKSLDNEDREKLLYWVVKEMSNARARLWLSTQKYGHERASKVV